MFESCLRNNDAATDWFSVSLRFFMLLHGQQWNRFEKNDKRGGNNIQTYELPFSEPTKKTGLPIMDDRRANHITFSDSSSPCYNIAECALHCNAYHHSKTL